jgi:hypothetical protein
LTFLSLGFGWAGSRQAANTALPTSTDDATMKKSAGETTMRPTQSTGTASAVKGSPSKYAPKIEVALLAAEMGAALPAATSAEMRLYFRELFNLPPHLADALWLLLQQQGCGTLSARTLLPPSAAEWLTLLGQGQAGYLLTLEGLQGFTHQQLTEALQKLSGLLQTNQGVMQKGMGKELQVLFELVQRQLSQTQASPLQGLSTLLGMYLPNLDPFKAPDALTCLWLPWQGQVPQVAGQAIVPLSQGKGKGEQETTPSDEQQLVVYLTTAHLGRFRLALRLVPSPTGGSGAQHCSIVCQHETQRFSKEVHRPKLVSQLKEKLPKSLWPSFTLQWATLAPPEANQGGLVPVAGSAMDPWQRQRQHETTKAVSPTQGVDALLILYAQYVSDTLLYLDEREGLRQQRQDKNN